MRAFPATSGMMAACGPAVLTLAIAGCAFLMFSLPLRTQLTFFIWAGAGLLVYALYGYSKSPLSQPK